MALNKSDLLEHPADYADWLAKMNPTRAART